MNNPNDVSRVRRDATEAGVRTLINTTLAVVDALPVLGNAASVGEMGSALIRIASKFAPILRRFNLTPDVSDGAVAGNVALDALDLVTVNLIPGSSTFLPFAVMQLTADLPRIIRGVKTLL